MKRGRKPNPYNAEAAEYGLNAPAVSKIGIDALSRMTEDARRVMYSSARWQMQNEGREYRRRIPIHLLVPGPALVKGDERRIRTRLPKHYAKRKPLMRDSADRIEKLFELARRVA